MNGKVWVGLVVAVLGAGCVALASGYSVMRTLGVDGKAQVAFSANNVWKPVCVAVVFEGAAERTVLVRRIREGVTYELTRVTGTGGNFVHWFDGPVWFAGTETLEVEVSPISAGQVEVICE